MAEKVTGNVDEIREYDVVQIVDDEYDHNRNWANEGEGVQMAMKSKKLKVASSI